jgi:hypothetical protein
MRQFSIGTRRDNVKAGFKEPVGRPMRPIHNWNPCLTKNSSAIANFECGHDRAFEIGDVSQHSKLSPRYLLAIAQEFSSELLRRIDRKPHNSIRAFLH